MISIFDLFSIGLGPSSSHTVGPMRAAKRFLLSAKTQSLLVQTTSIHVDLYGSLALTGKGHKTDTAIILGLLGHQPETILPEKATAALIEIQQSKTLNLLGETNIPFTESEHLKFHYKQALPEHANGMMFTLYNADHQILLQERYFSIGGGFVLSEIEIKQETPFHTDRDHKGTPPYPFKSAKTLMKHCKEQACSIADIMFKNELYWRSKDKIETGILNIWSVMASCIDKGRQEKGILPGGLKVKRRAPDLYQKLMLTESNDEMNWVNLYAIAVNEENAAGGRVVTAPTNGAAGIIPAVLRYYLHFHSPEHTDKQIIDFLLTAAAIGVLYKEGASISAAEVGCQGEVGVACSMAAAALCAILGGNIEQVANAAEIGMEHNLGLTCDPVGGLVQIPCIERNTMGAVQAINAAKLALLGDGCHFISLDEVIATMRETGIDMQSKYKETATGGLAVAVNLPNC